MTRYRKYLLTVLLALLAANNVDGLAFGLLLQEIKIDLSLTDTQLGLVSGIAFAFFYSTIGIPIARLADRGNRVVVLSVTAVIRSLFVALCAAAGNFLHLLLVRVGIGVGEAGCIPTIHSLIADNFSRAERPRAIAIVLQGNTLSIIVGYFLAGWLNEYFGWRMTFVLLGLPGLALAALTWLTLREPRRAAPNEVDGQPDILTVCRTLWLSRTFRKLLLAFAVAFFFGAGMVQWQPAFFARSYGLGTGELGTWLTLIYGVAGMAGMFLGGEWASRVAPNNERLQLKAMAIAYCAYCLAFVLIYLSTNHYLAFGLMAIGTLLGTMTTAPLFAVIQGLIPGHMRATAIAFVYLVANLVGLGLGPVATGALSDALLPVFGSESLRYALLLLCPGFLWVAGHLWSAAGCVDQDLAAVELR
jgi:predicted MFS family arabinose efflux permease